MATSHSAHGTLPDIGRNYSSLKAAPRWFCGFFKAATRVSMAFDRVEVHHGADAVADGFDLMFPRKSFSSLRVPPSGCRWRERGGDRKFAIGNQFHITSAF